VQDPWDEQTEESFANFPKQTLILQFDPAYPVEQTQLSGDVHCP
jgi:hypothetical protein